MALWKRLFSLKWVKKSSPLEQILGVRITNNELYELALRHSSSSQAGKRHESYERLEFLGDAIIGAIIADYLFKKYPFEKEGFLTEMRSKIVNRERLNQLSKKIGLDSFIEYQPSEPKHRSHKSMSGDVLEAIVGALYLDLGYEACQKFLLKQIIVPHLDIDAIQHTTTNFKSTIVEWCQKNNKALQWEIVGEKGKSHNKEFVAEVWIDHEVKGTGSGQSKKKAEQEAARKACEALNLLS